MSKLIINPNIGLCLSDPIRGIIYLTLQLCGTLQGHGVNGRKGGGSDYDILHWIFELFLTMC